VPLCAAAAGAVAAGAAWLARPLPGPARLAAAAVALLGVFALLLAYTQGISPRSVRRALRKDPARQA
jgi:hypothetical protein